jgi:hypothetical protein
MNDWTFIVAVLSLILSVLAFVAAAGCIVYVVGLRNSTHQNEWRPLMPEKKKPAEAQAQGSDEESDGEIDEPRTF